MSRIVLNLGSGRSGTTFLYNLLVANCPNLTVWHEALDARTARRQALFRCDTPELIQQAIDSPAIRKFLDDSDTASRSKPLVILGGTVSHLTPVFLHHFGADSIAAIHVHRHPFFVAAAAATAGGPELWQNVPVHGVDPNAWKLTPSDPRVRFPSFQERWATRNHFIRCLFQWAEQTAYAEEFPTHFPQVAFQSIPSSDCFANPQAFVTSICNALEVEPPREITIPQHRNSTWQRSREHHPLKRSHWEPALEITDFIEFCQQLGYDCSPEFLEKPLAKYALPARFSSWMRHYSGYWTLRHSVAKLLRTSGLLPTPVIDHTGADPRPTSAALSEVAESLLERTGLRKAKPQ